MRGEPVLKVRQASLRYGATTALDAVSLDLDRSEVHALVGENGAGKSSLLRAVAGAARLTEGRLERAANARVEWVSQDTDLPPDLTAAEWIFLSREWRTRAGWLRRRAMRDAAAEALREVGCRAAPGARVGSLPLPQRKQVQLARAMRSAPEVLLLDEPTAVLGEAETRQLFAVVRALRARGTAVLYVSHRLEEVLALADRVTVLRDGKRVSTDPLAAVDVATLVRRMVGREIPPHVRGERQLGERVLEVEAVAAAGLRDVSLSLRAGEVVGLAGLVGAGRSELLEAVAGLRRLRGGTLRCGVRAAIVPEDRGTKGLIGSLGLRENVFLPADTWLLRRGRERAATRQWISRLRVRASGTEAAIDSLSGGNQQKVLLARALRHRPRLLLLDEPTAGVDVGAKAEIHALIRELAMGGTAILLASSDLPELLVLCDRIVALRAGTVAGALSAAEANEQRLAALITGAEG